MSELQIKITVGTLDIFLQGDGDLVYKVFSDIKENGIGKLGSPEIQKEKKKNNSLEDKVFEKQNSDTPKSSLSSTATTIKTRKRANQPSGQLLKDLDMSGKNGENKSLKDFISEKNPKSNVQKTATFVYYLQNILKEKEITIDHIFTCYKILGVRIPNNLQQNLADTCSSRYGYTSRKEGKYSMTVVGNNFIEFDMNNED